MTSFTGHNVRSAKQSRCWHESPPATRALASEHSSALLAIAITVERVDPIRPACAALFSKPPLSGRFLERLNSTRVLALVSYHIETRQAGRSKGRRNSHVGGITSLRDHHAPDPGMVMPRIEGEPATVKEHLVPCAKIHRGRITRYANVTQVTCAVPRRDIHASGKRHGKMGEVPADAATFLVSLRGRAVSPGVMVAELNAVVSVVTNRLRSLPAALDAAEERPRKGGELFGVAIATT
jgi:hypothetical protein